MVTRTQQLEALAKQQGVVSISKAIIEESDKYAKAITEKEFIDMLVDEAKAYQKQCESLEQAFSKMFSADTSEGLLLRQAHAATSELS
jgi:hypothetical protein